MSLTSDRLVRLTELSSVGVSTPFCLLHREEKANTVFRIENLYCVLAKKLVKNMSSNSGISQSISNSHVHGSVQAAQGIGNQQIQTNRNESKQKQLSQADVITLLNEIRQLIDQTDLPETAREDASAYLGAAQKAASKEEPNKELVKVNLKGAAETLETVSKTVDTGKSLWEKSKPLLSHLATWLGVATSYFGF